MGRAWLLLLLVSLSACESSGAGTFRPAEAEVSAAPSTLIVPLPDGRVIFEAEDRLVLVDPDRPEQEPMVIGLASDVGEVHAAIPSLGATLVLASGGVFILRDATWVPSPLVLDGPVRDAVLLPSPTGRGTGDLWIATATSLYRVVDDRAERLALDEDLSSVELAIAQRPEGPSLWVRLEDRVLEVWRDRNGALRTASLVLEGELDAIGGDRSLTGWLVLDGSLHSIGADRRVIDHGIAVARLLTSPLATEIWVWSPDGAVWLHSDDRFYSVEGLDVSAGDTVALGADGSLFVAGATARRFSPRHRVTMGGPVDGSLLADAVDFPIEVQGAPTIEATLDGEGIAVSDPPSLTIDPSTLTEGTHELVVRIVFDDGTLPTVTRRSFEVLTNATWSEDIGPLYQMYCSDCHGEAGPANTRLDGMSNWQTEIEKITDNVTEGRMPLGRPPLSQREVALIELWSRLGYPE